MDDAEKKIEKALKLAFNFGCIDGAHHKMWTIDQMVRALLGDDAKYEDWVAKYQAGEDGAYTYDWSEGIAP